MDSISKSIISFMGIHWYELSELYQHVYCLIKEIYSVPLSLKQPY